MNCTHTSHRVQPNDASRLAESRAVPADRLVTVNGQRHTQTHGLCHPHADMAYSDGSEVINDQPITPAIPLVRHQRNVMYLDAVLRRDADHKGHTIMNCYLNDSRPATMMNTYEPHVINANYVGTHSIPVCAYHERFRPGGLIASVPITPALPFVTEKHVDQYARLFAGIGHEPTDEDIQREADRIMNKHDTFIPDPSLRYAVDPLGRGITFDGSITLPRYSHFANYKLWPAKIIFDSVVYRPTTERP